MTEWLDLINRGGVLAILILIVFLNITGKWRSERSHQEIVELKDGEIARERARADRNEELAWRLVTTTERAADVATVAVGKAAS